MNYYLGIDIGTSGCKAAVFNDSGLQVAHAHRDYSIVSPHKGWAELNPEEVIECCFQVIRESASGLHDGKVCAMGISSQGEAFTIINKEGQSVCNAFVSSDTRADNYVSSWSEEFGSEKLYHITGHTPHPMFSLFKLLWVRDNMPNVWSNAYKILCFEDLLQFRLGIKNPAMGWPLAGRTMLFDVTNHYWSKEILNKAGLKVEQLSRPLQSGSVAGYVDKDIAKSLFLSESILVVTGGHDQPCSALGAGAIDPGMSVYATGTVECITPAFSQPIFSESLRKNNFCTYDHAFPGMYSSVAFSLTGGNLIRWFLDTFGEKELADAKRLSRDPYEILLEQIPHQPSNLLVLPYFTPSGTPYFDTSVRGAIIGMDLSTKREEILKALLEGVAFEIKLNLEILENSGYKINELRAIGGGAKSNILTQLKANVINKPITTLNITEAGCMGVAMLSMAKHVNQEIRIIVEKWVKPVSIIKPFDSDFYQKRFIQYKKLYSDLKKYEI
jgi:xylulokinase